MEQHHPKDLLAVEEFLMLRKQVMIKPAAPLTVASSIDDEDETADAADDDDVTDEAPPGVDDQPSSDAALLGSDNKSKVCTCFKSFFITFRAAIRLKILVLVFQLFFRFSFHHFFVLVLPIIF